MKSLILVVCVISASIFVFPGFFPSLNHHAFSLGEVNFRWCHVLSAILVWLALKGK